MKIKMRRSIRTSNPGQVEFIGQRYLDHPEIQLFSYNEAGVREQDLTQESTRLPDLVSDEVHWLNVHGIHDADLVSRVCSKLDVPRFIVQDILDTNQRVKIQELDNLLFLSVRSFLPGDNTSFEVEHISFLIGENLVFSFQEKKGDHFEHIRERIRENNGLVRKRGGDFLLFLLVEAILANYYSSFERLEEETDERANPLKTKSTDPLFIQHIESFKRNILVFRKNITALRDAMASIEKGSYSVIAGEQLKYFYDVKDNCLQILEGLDTLQQRLDSAENLFFSVQGHRMNQVMTTLTIMAAIFIPLTFMAGIYGMNFSNMPELDYEYGYFILLGAMILVSIGLIYFFKKRKWF